MKTNDELTQRVSATIEVLNVRIARLASALHVLLNDRTELAALMATQPAQPVDKDRRSSADDEERVYVGFDRRQTHLREELRGLLVLRYHMETTSLHDNGLEVTRQAMVQAEAHLLRQGFKPGADGLDLDVLFNAVN